MRMRLGCFIHSAKRQHQPDGWHPGSYVGLVAMRGNGAVLLEPGEEVLDQLARLDQRLDDPGLRVISLEIRRSV